MTLEDLKYKLKVLQQQKPQPPLASEAAKIDPIQPSDKDSTQKELQIREAEVAELKTQNEELKEMLVSKDKEIADQKVEYIKIYEKYKKYHGYCQKFTD